MADYISQFTGGEIDRRLAKVSDLEAGKQDKLESGENIKTVGGQSLLGAGNIPLTDQEAVKFTPQTLTAAQKAQAQANIGAASEEEVAALADQKYEGPYATSGDLPAASASTMGAIYLVGPDANGEYDRYVTKLNGSTYTWASLGKTSIDLANYATKAEVGELEAEVDGLSNQLYNNFFIGEGNQYVSRNIYGLLPNTKYIVRLPSVNWDMTGVTQTGVYKFEILIRLGNTIVSAVARYATTVTIPKNEFEFTTPNAGTFDHLLIGGRAAIGEKVYFSLSNEEQIEEIKGEIENINDSITDLQFEVYGETTKVLLSPSRDGTIYNAGNQYAVTWLNIPCKNADIINVCVKKPFSASGNVYVFGYTMAQGDHDNPADDIANGFYQDTIDKVLPIPCAGLESINIQIYETSLPFSYPSSVTPLRTTDFQSQQGLEYFVTKSASLYNLFETRKSAGIVGKGNTYVSYKVYGLLPGKTYGIRVSNWDWSGVTTTTAYTYEIVNFVGEEYTRLFYLFGVQTPIPDVVFFTIPNVSSYIQIGGRITNGVTALFEIYEVEQSPVEKNYTYIGQPLSLNKYGLRELFSLSDLGTLINPMSSQGFDIKDNILCQLGSSSGTNTIVIANISTRTKLGEIIFTDTSYHMNNVNMGSKYEQNDTYPLLWISQCYGVHKCAVVRLNNDLSGYTLIQEIKYTGTEHFSGSNAYDWAIDELNGFIYAIGNSPNGSRIEVVKFALPQISGSDVIFTDSDVLDSFALTDAPSVYQGSRVIGGRIFMPFGFGTVNEPAIICVIDTNSKSIATRVPLSSVGEVEACTPYKDGLIINNNSNNPIYRYLEF